MSAEAERAISAAGHLIVDMILPSLAILSHGTVIGRGPDSRIFSLAMYVMIRWLLTLYAVAARGSGARHRQASVAVDGLAKV
jgi:hypothetical protein